MEEAAVLLAKVAGLAGAGAGAIREMDLNPSSWIRRPGEPVSSMPSSSPR